MVLGMGRSGQAAAEWLLAHGAEVTMFDETQGVEMKKIARGWEGRGVRVLLGEERMAGMKFDRAILSPGIDPRKAVVRNLVEAGVPMMGELELGWQACLCPMVAVTGTNGKSTTTELIAAIYSAAGKKAVACGNLGKPLSEVAPLTKGLDGVVVEVSSFQLETVETFCPKVGVYLNFTPDHLDRYSTLEEYRAAKAKIFLNFGEKETAIVQRGLAVATGKARRVTFTSEASGADFTLNEGWLCCEGVRLMRQEETQLKGPHNAENLLAAWAVAEAQHLSRDAVKKAFQNYRALPHRCEVVRVRAGVTWVNDSKATNIDAMERAVVGIEGGVILIAGGKDKGFDFSGSRKSLEGKVRGALLIGEMAERMERAWEGAVPCRKVKSMKEAVERAAEMAMRGETVLLSPGCSSYDMFQNFEDRGEKYRQCVVALPEEKTENE